MAKRSIKQKITQYLINHGYVTKNLIALMLRVTYMLYTKMGYILINLTPRLENQIRQLALLSNPNFYKKQALGLSKL